MLGSYAPRYTVLPISWEHFIILSTLRRWDYSAAIRSCLASFRIGSKQFTRQKFDKVGFFVQFIFFYHSNKNLSKQHSFVGIRRFDRFYKTNFCSFYKYLNKIFVLRQHSARKTKASGGLPYN